MHLLTRMWNDENGFVVSTELILLATIAVIGLLVGMAAVRDGVISELSDVAGAVQDVNQGYSYDGVIGHNAATAGSNYIDRLDECDNHEDVFLCADNCITFNQGPINEGTEVTERN